MILAALLDMIVLPIPYNWVDRAWQISFTTQVVDRGIIPLLGLALLMTGLWFEGGSAGKAKGLNRSKGLKTSALVLACVLGLFYILIFPLHLNNVRLDSRQTQEQISQEATQAEAQLDSRLNAEVGQQQGQISQLLANPQQLAQALQSGQVTQEQAALLEEFRDDPAALDQFLEERAGQLRTQLQTEIGMRREEATSRAKTEALKSGLRIGLSSLLLAIGYIVVGWTGLKTAK